MFVSEKPPVWKFNMVDSYLHLTVITYFKRGKFKSIYCKKCPWDGGKETIRDYYSPAM